MCEIRSYPVLAPVKPGALTQKLPASAPERGEPMERILADFCGQVIPAVTHWNHPGFHAFFSVSGAPPGILAEFLTAALNINEMLWKSCPAATELEQVTLDWLRQWLGMPPGWFGIIYDTASTSTMHAIVGAREKALAERGARLEDLVLYCSDQAHSSVDKGAITAGIPRTNIRKIPSDGDFRLQPHLLEAAVEADERAGKVPFCVTATVGTTPSTAVDPVPAIASISARHRIWLHVDGAYGGLAAIVPGRRWVLAGADGADSLVVNPHKWLLTPIDLSAFYTRHPEWLRRAFSLVPEYLRTDEQTVNLMDYGMQLGRRFRSLKLWFVMRYYGRDGLAAIIDQHCRWAQELASWVQADPRFELCAPVPLSFVCFHARGRTNQENQAWLDRINATGAVFLSGTTLRDVFVLRFAIGNHQTTRDDIVRAWEVIRSQLDGPAPTQYSQINPV
jgi:aromatic-L-amino-acid decarboxylase